MKKLITILAFVVVCSVAKSQELGIRFGDVVGNDVAVDALFSTGKFSRVHADVLTTAIAVAADTRSKVVTHGQAPSVRLGLGGQVLR